MSFFYTVIKVSPSFQSNNFCYWMQQLFSKAHFFKSTTHVWLHWFGSMQSAVTMVAANYYGRQQNSICSKIVRCQLLRTFEEQRYPGTLTVYISVSIEVLGHVMNERKKKYTIINKKRIRRWRERSKNVMRK